MYMCKLGSLVMHGRVFKFIKYFSESWYQGWQNVCVIISEKLDVLMRGIHVYVLLKLDFEILSCN